MLLRIIGEIIVSRDRSRCVLLSFLTSRSSARNLSPSRLPVSPIYNLLRRVHVVQWMTLAEVQVK